MSTQNLPFYDPRVAYPEYKKVVKESRSHMEDRRWRLARWLMKRLIWRVSPEFHRYVHASICWSQAADLVERDVPAVQGWRD